MFCLSKLPWMFCSFFTKLWFKMCNNRVKLRLSNKRLNLDQFYVSQANITALFFFFFFFFFLFVFFFFGGGGGVGRGLVFFSECVKIYSERKGRKTEISLLCFFFFFFVFFFFLLFFFFCGGWGFGVFFPNALKYIPKGKEEKQMQHGMTNKNVKR